MKSIDRLYDLPIMYPKNGIHGLWWGY